jgi:hypothetical protein
MASILCILIYFFMCCYFQAPGDPSYDQVRQFRSMKMPTVDAESYVSGIASTSAASSSAASRGRDPVRHSPTPNAAATAASYTRPPSAGRQSSRDGDGLASFSRENVADEDWELTPSLNSPIRSNGSSPRAHRDSGGGMRARPSSAPARRSSPRQQQQGVGLSPRQAGHSPREALPSPRVVSSGTSPRVMPSNSGNGNSGNGNSGNGNSGNGSGNGGRGEPPRSPVVTQGKQAGSKLGHAGTGHGVACADSASIVLKLRQRNVGNGNGNFDSRDINGSGGGGGSRVSKGSPAGGGGSGVSFSTLSGHCVTKSGSPVRGTVEPSRLSLEQDSEESLNLAASDMMGAREGGHSRQEQASVSIPTAPLMRDKMREKYSDEASSDGASNIESDVNRDVGRERRSSSGATSSGLSATGLTASDAPAYYY